jgi:hypothetical protein
MANLRFNRKELFTQEETKGVMNILSNFYDLDSDLENMIYGLFDGYYYTNMMDLVSDSEIAADQKSFDFLANLANKIQYARFSKITLD